MPGKMGARKLQPWVQGLQIIPGMLAIDAKLLYDLMENQCGLPAEKRAALALISVCEGFGRMTHSIHGVPPRWMLADTMTKNVKNAQGLRFSSKRAHFPVKVWKLESED